MEPEASAVEPASGPTGPGAGAPAGEGEAGIAEPSGDPLPVAGLLWPVGYVGGMPADLTAESIRAAIPAAGGTWSRIEVSARVGSTNTQAAAAAAAGAPTGTAFVTDFQSSGRGRLDRTWEAPPGSSAMFSVVLRPGSDDRAFGVLPLLCGLAVAEAIESVTGLVVGLKWPNDVIVTAAAQPPGPVAGRSGKVAGLLAERGAAAVVVGVGINVSTAELPVPTASSLALAGAQPLARAQLIGAALARIEHWFKQWDRVAGSAPESGGQHPAIAEQAAAPLDEYRRRCTTLGREVRVVRPGGTQLAGLGVGIGPSGELLVDVGDRVESVVVGDVIHAVEL